MKLTAQLELFSTVRFIDKLLFTKHLSMMTASSITVLEAVDILAAQTESQLLKKILLGIKQDVRNGKSLSEAMSKYPKVFDTFYTSIIEVGETSGTLDKSLAYLSTQLAKDYAFRKKVQGAMMYPAIVLSAAGIVGVGISLFVLPKLVDLFKGFDVNLPLSTKLLLSFAGIMQHFGFLLLILLVGLILLVRILLMRKEVKPYLDRGLLYMPIFGKILRNAELTSFCRNFGILLQGGVPLTSALVIMVKITTNSVFQYYVVHLLAASEKGKSLSEELSDKYYSNIPLLVTKMIAVGEKTGNLDDTLLYLADFFEDEVDDATRNISTLLEPIMLLLIGGIVAFVALAIISPIYQLTGSINK